MGIDSHYCDFIVTGTASVQKYEKSSNWFVCITDPVGSLLSFFEVFLADAYEHIGLSSPGWSTAQLVGRFVVWFRRADIPA